MTTYRFQEIKHPEKRTFTCSVCGKRATVSRTFSQTINPFNKLPDGTVKTENTIREELRAKGQAWHPEAIHDKCRGTQS
jgi:hypothetical protein